MSTRRANRVNDFLREELSDLIRRMKDPRLAVIASITEVVCSPDLRSAKVYVSTLGDDAERQRTVDILRGAASYLRRELRPRLSVKNVPFMTFYRDDSIEEGTRLSGLIDRALVEANTDPTDIQTE